MKEKINREHEIENYVKTINSLSYLKDEEALQQYKIKRKNEVVEEIIRVQTSSVEEILAHRGIHKKSATQEMVMDGVERIIEHARHAQQHPERESGLPYGMTPKEVLEMADEDLFNKVRYYIDAHMDAEYNRAIRGVQEEKKKYAGVTREELDTYADLLVQKETIEGMLKLRETEVQLEDLRKHPLKREADEVVSIEILDQEQQEYKEAVKASLGSVVKFVGICSGGILVFLTAVSQTIVLPMIAALGTCTVGIGLIRAVQGASYMRLALKNQKVEKKLKEQGLYDLYIEAAHAEQQVADYEEEKGMVL